MKLTETLEMLMMTDSICEVNLYHCDITSPADLIENQQYMF